MKTIFTLLSLTIFLTTGYAQNPNQVPRQMDATIHKTFAVTQDGTERAYNVKILEHRKYPMAMEGTDKNKIDQNRKSTPASVIKLIAVDSDNDQNYDHYMVLKYTKTVTDSFELVPTSKGFAVKVDDKTLEYFVSEGIYFINNKDQDFFTVEEFKEIG